MFTVYRKLEDTKNPDRLKLLDSKSTQSREEAIGTLIQWTVTYPTSIVSLTYRSMY